MLPRCPPIFVSRLSLASGSNVSTSLSYQHKATSNVPRSCRKAQGQAKRQIADRLAAQVYQPTSLPGHAEKIRRAHYAFYSSQYFFFYSSQYYKHKNT